MASLSPPISLRLLLLPRRAPPVVTCGPRDNRMSIQRGRVLSSESILAIQTLKRNYQSSPPPTDSPKFPTQTFSRLLKPDLVAIILELNRQSQPNLALEVFNFLRADPSYKTDLCLYAALISAFGELELGNGDEAGGKIDGLVEELLGERKEGFKEEERMKVTRVVKGLIKGKRGEAVKRVYGEMKRWGFVMDEYLYRVLFRGLKRIGEEEGAKEVERDFEEWWYQESPVGKLSKEMKALDEMPERRRRRVGSDVKSM